MKKVAMVFAIGCTCSVLCVSAANVICHVITTMGTTIGKLADLACGIIPNMVKDILASEDK